MERIIAALTALGVLVAIAQFLESIKMIEWLTLARIFTLVINLCIFGALALVAKRLRDILVDIDLLYRAKVAHDTRLGNLESWRDSQR